MQTPYLLYTLNWSMWMHMTIKNVQTGWMERQKVCKGDLLDKLQVAEGARVMLIKNIDVEDGLVNDSFGKTGKIFIMPKMAKQL